MSKGTRITIRYKDMQILSTEICVIDVIEDGTNTIFMVPESELRTTGDLVNINLQKEAVSSSLEDGSRKRPNKSAVDNQ
jgi:hypothetical protein